MKGARLSKNRSMTFARRTMLGQKLPHLLAIGSTGRYLGAGWAPKPSSRSSGEHLGEDTVYLAQFLWGLSVNCQLFIVENGFSLSNVPKRDSSL